MRNQYSKPKKVTQFRGRLTMSVIRGTWFPGIKDGAFVVVWGRFNNCFAYLHDFDPISRNMLIELCKDGIEYCEFPHLIRVWQWPE